MKKFANTIILFVVATVVMLLVIAGNCIFENANNYEKFSEEKYLSKSGYSIQVQKSSGHYSGFLGQDKENIYLDLFQDGKYFGGSVGSVKENDTIWVYQFQQYETLVVVFGDNRNSKYHSYSLEVGSTTTEPKTIEKEIKEDKYILDIYELDTKYNGTANLELNK